ncbi:MAG: dipeptidase [Roseitalea sp.]|jgi:membrane dipeptidase|nr:dipeptidase [Roseitalea sp.]MBO6721662.1 dipeptidase [Roseitalea sp.]MBO6743550.1 dipeptidase [Roseitalea sp.]
MRIFDGHNDLLFRLWDSGDQDGMAFLSSDGQGHVDLARARSGGFAGGLFAVFADNPEFELALASTDASAAPLSMDGIGPISQSYATTVCRAQIAIAHRIFEARPDALRICTSTQHIEQAMSDGAVACVLHVEGLEMIDDPEAQLPGLYDRGVRSIGPVWSRPNRFGHGVPFRYPAHPDTGPGLSAAGFELVEMCQQMGILVDVAHMNAAGIADVASVARKPFVSSHAGVHALCPASRNHTDRQLRTIARSGGLVGIVLNTDFIRPDGRADPDTDLSVFVAHIRHVIDLAGIEAVALGSDFDGGPVANDLPDCGALPRLVRQMEAGGLTGGEIEAVCHGNWRRVLSDTID